MTQCLRGDSANAVPHDINDAPEFPTFGEIAEVNSTAVQWSSLALGEPPCWSWLTPTPGKYAQLLPNFWVHQISINLLNRFLLGLLLKNIYFSVLVVNVKRICKMLLQNTMYFDLKIVLIRHQLINLLLPTFANLAPSSESCNFCKHRKPLSTNQKVLFTPHYNRVYF